MLPLYIYITYKIKEEGKKNLSVLHYKIRCLFPDAKQRACIYTTISFVRYFYDILEEQWIGFPLHTVDNIRTYVVTTTGMCMSPQHRLIKIYIGEAL